MRGPSQAQLLADLGQGCPCSVPAANSSRETPGQPAKPWVLVVGSGEAWAGYFRCCAPGPGASRPTVCRLSAWAGGSSCACRVVPYTQLTRLPALAARRESALGAAGCGPHTRHQNSHGVKFSSGISGKIPSGGAERGSLGPSGLASCLLPAPAPLTGSSNTTICPLGGAHPQVKHISLAPPRGPQACL